jgi:hypothetical protein
LKRAYRTLLPHLALPLAAWYGEMTRLQEARKAMEIVSNKSVLNVMREGWFYIGLKRVGQPNQYYKTYKEMSKLVGECTC